MATAIGTGTTVTHMNLVGNLLSVSIDGVEITAIDNTHMGTTDYRSLIAGSLANPGQVTLELQFDPATIPTLGGAASDLVITWPTADTWTASAFLMSFSVGAQIEEQMTGSFTFQLTTGFAR